MAVFLLITLSLPPANAGPLDDARLRLCVGPGPAWGACFTATTSVIGISPANDDVHTVLSADGQTEYMAGATRWGTEIDWTVAAIHADGGPKWKVRAGIAGTQEPTIRDLALSLDGTKVLVLGDTVGSELHSVIRAFSTTNGALVWESVDTHGHGVALAVSETEVIIAKNVPPGGGAPYDHWDLRGLLLSNGALYSGYTSSASFDTVSVADIQIAPTMVHVIGKAPCNPPGRCNSFVLAVSVDEFGLSFPLWERHDSSIGAWERSVRTSQGAILVAGVELDELVVVGYDIDGAIVIESIIPGASIKLLSIQAFAGGDALILYETTSATGQREGHVSRVAPDGIRWTVSTATPNVDDGFVSAALSPQGGRVYVAQRSLSPTNTLVIGLDANLGTEMWRDDGGSYRLGSASPTALRADQAGVLLTGVRSSTLGWGVRHYADDILPELDAWTISDEAVPAAPNGLV